jgi:predicted Zn-dependent peptidase
MNPEKLHRFRNKWYGKDNIFIVVVGDLDFNRVMNTVNDTLPKAPDVETTPLCLNDYASSDKSFKFETNRFEQASFGLVGRWLSRAETMKQDYISNFFLFALSKYMHEYIRDDLGLCYGIDSQRFSHFDNTHIIISMLTNNSYLEKAEKELTNLFNKVKAEGFPDEIYQISKKQLTYNQVKVLCHSHGMASSIVNGVLGSRIPNWFLNEGSNNLSPTWLKKVATKLTQNDLKEFANQWLNNFSTFTMISTK